MLCFRLAAAPPVSALLASWILWQGTLPAGEAPEKELRVFLESAKTKIPESDLKRIKEALGKSTRRPPRKPTAETSTIRTSSEPLPEEPPAEEPQAEDSGEMLRNPPEKVYQLDGNQLQLVEHPQSLLEQGVSPEEEVSLIVKVQHLPTNQVSQTIQSLLSAHGKSQGQELRIVPVEGTPKLIFTGKAALIDYALRILHALDVPAVRAEPEADPELEPEPERIVQIFDVKFVEASDLASLITEFLKATEKRVESPRIPTRISTTRSRTSISRPSSTQYYDVYETNILVDPRTQKLIVKTYSKQDLEDIQMLLKELDVRIE